MAQQNTAANPQKGGQSDRSDKCRRNRLFYVGDLAEISAHAEAHPAAQIRDQGQHLLRAAAMLFGLAAF
jgi:hypothetical protein